jgi:RNA polymerase sigma-70 factor (ECF subfamily)
MAVAPPIRQTAGIAPPGVAAAQGLYQRHAALVFRYCLHRLRRREDAEDAMQTTFLHAFRALGRGVVPATETAWLQRIAHNVCLTHWSTARRRSSEQARDPQALAELAGEERVAWHDLIGLEECLARLPERQRLALLLREWQGLSYLEIASELGISLSAVETLLFRARRSLAQLLEGERPVRPAGRLSGLDLGSLGLAFKSAFAGGAAKVAVAVVGVTAATLVATSDPLSRDREANVIRRVAVASPALVVRPVETMAAARREHAGLARSLPAPDPRAARPAHARPPARPDAPARATRPAAAAPRAEPAAAPAQDAPAPTRGAPEPAAPTAPPARQIVEKAVATPVATIVEPVVQAIESVGVDVPELQPVVAPLPLPALEAPVVETVAEATTAVVETVGGLVGPLP